MYIVKTMSNFCIRNIDLVVMMKKHVKLSANSNNVRGQVSRITQDTKSTTIYIYMRHGYCFSMERSSSQHSFLIHDKVSMQNTAIQATS